MKLMILAGGMGKRLWPYSKKEAPKPFLPLFEGRSLFQMTLSRWLNLFKPEDIWIVSHEQNQILVQEQLREFSFPFNDRILWEPESKNTAAALCFGLQNLEEKGEISERDCILIVPSDHLFSQDEILFKNVVEAERLAKLEKLVLFGITPSRPETGYGYIQFDSQEGESFFPILKFVEKPSLEEASKMIEQATFLWNSGMLLVQVKTFWRELNTHCSELAQFFQNKNREFSTLPGLSLDYALLEKTASAVVIPLDIQWSDVGSWDAIYEVEKKDKDGNIFKGNIQAIDCRNNLILSSKKTTSIIGLEDILVIDCPEGLLIVKKGHSQKVKLLEGT